APRRRLPRGQPAVAARGGSRQPSGARRRRAARQRARGRRHRAAGGRTRPGRPPAHRGRRHHLEPAALPRPGRPAPQRALADRPPHPRPPLPELLPAGLPGTTRMAARRRRRRRAARDPRPARRPGRTAALPPVLPARRRHRRRLRRAHPRPARSRPAGRGHRRPARRPARTRRLRRPVLTPASAPRSTASRPRAVVNIAAAITEAAVESTWFHPHRHGTVTAVVEAPMWGVTAVADGSPAADAEAVLRSASHALRRDTLLLAGLTGRVRPHLAGVPDAARLLAPVDDYLLVCPGLADAWDPDCGNDSSHPLPPMTTARLTAVRLAGLRLVLRTAGLLHQLVTRAGRDPAGALPVLERLIDARCADCRDGFGARWIAVSRQAEYQARVVLAAFELAVRAPFRSGEPGWGTGTAVPMHRE
ncbi:LOW QUALITY PROTEIN: 3-hydroxyacyl-CoA dehydrogenase, partial [Streptomyces griseoflavus Tu4000]